VIERLASVLAASGNLLDTASVMAVEESRHRIRRFPSELG